MEALVGEAARDYLGAQDRRVLAAASALKVAPQDVLSRIEVLLDERKKMERELADAKRQLAMGGGNSGSASADVVEINGTKVMARLLKGVSANDLKPLADEGKKTLGSGIVILVSVSEDGKGAVVAGVTADLTAKYNAVDLVKAGAVAMGGKGGGGRPDMAQAGGPDGAKSNEALTAIKALI